MARQPLRYSIALSAVLVSACGGGGDSAGLPPNTSYNAAAAWQNLLTQSHSYTVQGVASDGNAYRLTISIVPGGTAVFPVTGATANRSNITAAVERNGLALASAQTETFFDSNYLEIGSRTSQVGQTTVCELGVSAALPSTAATIGASGALSTSDALDGCSPTSSAFATTTSTWSIEFHDGVAYFCTNATVRDDATPPNTSSEQDCLEVEADGALGDRARITLTGIGVNLLATN